MLNRHDITFFFLNHIFNYIYKPILQISNKLKTLHFTERFENCGSGLLFVSNCCFSYFFPLFKFSKLLSNIMFILTLFTLFNL
jgi:hypothetical protein